MSQRADIPYTYYMLQSKKRELIKRHMENNAMLDQGKLNKINQILNSKYTFEFCDISKDTPEGVLILSIIQARIIAEGICRYVVLYKQIVKNIAMFSNLPKEKFSSKAFELYGNCGSAAVAIDICRQQNEMHKNKLCLATFGVGLSWGFAVLDTSNTYVPQIKKYITPDSKMTREQKISYWIDYYKGTIKS